MKTIQTTSKCLLKSYILQFVTEQKMLRKRHCLLYLKVIQAIRGHFLNNFPKNSDRFALIQSHTLICHQEKEYLRWMNKALRNMDDISDLKALLWIRKSHRSVPLFHDVQESLCWKSRFWEVSIFSFLSILIESNEDIYISCVYIYIYVCVYIYVCMYMYVHIYI